jgi:hypothetical protein
VAPLPRVTVILPTYNERASLEALHPRLMAALGAFDAEVLVVDDDSPDGTGDYVRSHERDGVYRLLSRPGRAGLATAVRDGLDQARGDIVVVMDADGSHPPETIPELVRPVDDGEAELALATRHRPGATVTGLPLYRQVLSAGASLLALPLTGVSDPMSGFFAIHRAVAGRARLAPSGFKICLEILVKCHPRPVVEVPYHFGSRIAGSSKLGSGQILNYVRHLRRLYAWQLGFGDEGPPTVTRIRVPVIAAGALLLAQPVGWGSSSGHPGPQADQDGAEAARAERGGTRLADERVLAHEVQAEPGDGGPQGEGDEADRQQPEGAFPTAAPGLDRVVAYQATEERHGDPEAPEHPNL